MHHGKKRSRPDPGNKAVICGDIARRETSAVDPETGQRPSFPPFESAQDSETEEGPPIDARAYIMAVRTQASSLPAFRAATRAETEVFANSFVPPQAGKHALVRNTRPKFSDEWRQRFLHDFTRLKEEMFRIPSSTSTGLPTNHPEWTLFLQSQSPSRASFVRGIAQAQRLKLLQWYPKWLVANTTDTQLSWLFALLVSIDPLLTSDDMAILRDLCRRCIKLRSASDTSQGVRAMCDMVIVIVADFYQQHDLMIADGTQDG